MVTSLTGTSAQRLERGLVTAADEPFHQFGVADVGAGTCQRGPAEVVDGPGESADRHGKPSWPLNIVSHLLLPGRRRFAARVFRAGPRGVNQRAVPHPTGRRPPATSCPARHAEGRRTRT